MGVASASSYWLASVYPLGVEAVELALPRPARRVVTATRACVCVLAVDLIAIRQVPSSHALLSLASNPRVEPVIALVRAVVESVRRRPWLRTLLFSLSKLLPTCENNQHQIVRLPRPPSPTRACTRN